MPCVGEVGSIYNVVQDATHQVSMHLKLGVLSDHNGTYIVRPALSLIVGVRSQQPQMAKPC